MGMLATSAVRSTGGYSPTGAYSIEFFKRGKRVKSREEPVDQSLGEYFFLCGLTNLDQTYTYKMSVESTFGGNSVVDFGNGQSPISLQGMIWPFYEGTAPRSKPVKSGGTNFASSADGLGSALGQGITEEFNGLNPFKKAGYLDFIDLVFLMQEIRDPVKATSRKPSASFAFFTAHDIRENNNFPKDKYLDSTNSKMVFHDYDRDAHWEVVFARDGFKISQSNKDPLSWFWSLNLIGIKDVSEQAQFRRPMIPDPKKMLRDIRSGLNNILQDLSEPLKLLSGVTDLYQDIANLAEDLKSDLGEFERENKSYLKKIFKAGGPINKKTNQFLDLVTKLVFPNETLPDWSSYDSPNPPITTETPPSQQVTPTLPANLVDNYFTQNPGSDAEIDLATDQTIQDMYALQMLMAKLTTAISELENESISFNYTYVVVLPGWTLEFIATIYYGSPFAVQALIRDNGLLLLGKNDDEIAGLRIRVPSVASFAYQDTGVLDKRYLINNETPEKTQEILEGWYFGEDLELDDSRDFTIKNGDLGTTKGLDCLVDNLLDRILLPPGSIPAHPDLGASPNPGGVPDNFLNLVIPNRILQNVRSDLGVQSVDMLEFAITGDEFRYTIEVQPIGGFKSFKLLRKRGLQSL